MRLLATLLAWLIAAPALADAVSERADAVAVVIYRDRAFDTAELSDWRENSEVLESGLALVTETRTLQLSAGRQRIAFRGVAEGILPQTAAIEGLPGRLFERNQDYNLLTPDALVDAFVGRPVRRVRTNRATGEEMVEDAVLRSGPGGVLLEIDGRLEALHCSGWAERLVFPSPPEGLLDQPTLSVVAEVPREGRYEIRLSYLAQGLNWSADYVAKLRPDGRTLDLTGWITLVNASGTSFSHAPTQVVAGDLSRVDDDDRGGPAPRQRTRRCWPMDTTTKVAAGPKVAPPPAAVFAYAEEFESSDDVEAVIVTGSRIAKAMAVMSNLGDYKLYTLPEPTTVAARQTKQVLFLDQEGVAFERLYTYRLRPDYKGALNPDQRHQAAVTLRLQNSERGGLGKPLPSGTVSVMEPSDAGRLVLAGEHRLDDVPIGLPADLEIGGALDIAVTPRLVFSSGDERATFAEPRTDRDLQTILEEVARSPAGKARHRYEVEVVNSKPVPVLVEISHDPRRGGFRILSSTRRHATKNGAPLWTLKLRSGAREVLGYTVEHED